MRIEKFFVGCVVIVLQLSAARSVIGDNAFPVSQTGPVVNGSSVLVVPDMQSGQISMHDAPIHPAPSSSSGAVEHGFSPFVPSGPSRVSDLLGFMQCDPHSCPNIWAGYESQRQADLRRKCTPHGHCGGYGHGCGHECGSCGTGACGAPCNGCGVGVVKNRYRHGSVKPFSCGDCSGAPASCACDSAPMEFSAITAPAAGHGIASSAVIPSIAPRKKFIR
jgi:hypothetical protein